MISETIALQRIFEDDTLTKALVEFFETQAASEKTAAAELMGSDHALPELARKHACMAEAYEEAMNRLKEYAKQV